jgi:hypothetical protein
VGGGLFLYSVRIRGDGVAFAIPICRDPSGAVNMIESLFINTNSVQQHRDDEGS